MSDTFITTTEFCKLTKISTSTMYKLIRSKDIPAKKIGGRWKIPASIVHSYFEDIDTSIYH